MKIITSILNGDLGENVLIGYTQVLYHQPQKKIGNDRDKGPLGRLIMGGAARLTQSLGTKGTEFLTSLRM